MVSRPGGFLQGVLLVLALFLFAGVFAIGIAFGVGAMLAVGQVDEVVLERTVREAGSQRIAVIPVSGGIDDAQARFVRAAVAHVMKDTSIDAVVLRVDSPGGGVSPSDQIWREVERLKQSRRPVVASFGGMAASGGYYVACGTDHIVAEPTTITGSIGVIAQILTMEGLMEKIGVQPVTLVASGSPQKDVANDLFRTWNDADRAKVKSMLDAAYAVFNKRVATGRASAIPDPKQVDAIANGSIYTAEQAVANGLADQIGYLDDAIAVAEQRATIPAGRASVVELVLPPPLFSSSGLLGRDASPRGVDADAIRSLLVELGSPRPMYLMH
ncbi:MAG: signal peptide peptidase SppA [Phycisphaerales bacterium]|nr:signal peptide peptidase SppA [Phycisphaerales bacterium]